MATLPAFRAQVTSNGHAAVAADGLVRACSLAELKTNGPLTPIGLGQSVVLFWHQDAPFAVDNRCPHMGFPLSKGFCKDGILTCYWHYARFDLKSGGTFDPFADDVLTFPVSVRGDDVWIDLRPRLTAEQERSRWTKRLSDALDQNISLVQAKAILALRDNPSGGDVTQATKGILSTAAEYALRYGSRRNRGGWGDGLTILTMMAALQDDLAPDDRPAALYHGTRRAGEDTAGQMLRVELEPLPETDASAQQLKRWFREFVEVRDGQAAERVVRTAIAAGWSPTALIDLLACAATDHYYRDFSHVMDTLSHASSLLDMIGWERAAEVLPSLTAQWASASREEEKNSWLHPEDLAHLVAERIPLLAGIVGHVAAPLTAAPVEAASNTWTQSLVDTLLGDDRARSLDAILDALRAGVSVAAAAQALAYASALRMTRFPTSNEFGDWDTALHSFTYCASLAQVAQRAPSAELARAILDGAMVVYQTRFLNVPAARLPNQRALAGMPDDPTTLLRQLSDACEGQGGVDEAGAAVYRYLTLGHDPGALIRALGQITLREDAGFHDYQTLQEGVRLAKDLLAEATRGEPNTGKGDAEKRDAAYQTLVAIARWQAAHAPTRRAVTQTYGIALRLHRGEAIYEEDKQTV